MVFTLALTVEIKLMMNITIEYILSHKNVWICCCAAFRFYAIHNGSVIILQRIIYGCIYDVRILK